VKPTASASVKPTALAGTVWFMRTAAASITYLWSNFPAEFQPSSSNFHDMPFTIFVIFRLKTRYPHSILPSGLTTPTAAVRPTSIAPDLPPRMATVTPTTSVHISTSSSSPLLIPNVSTGSIATTQVTSS
jgi:hypothetical protein